MNTQLELQEWLKDKFLKWQLSTGERKSLISFANYLGVSSGSLNQWINGIHLPKNDNVIKRLTI